METEHRTSLHPAWGFAAVGFYAVHAVTLVSAGEAPHLFWSCHLGCLVLAAGLFLSRPTLCGVALLWLAMGLPTWIASVLAVEGFSHLTSTLTHVFGTVLAVFAVRRSGMPRGTWWRAMAAFALLWILTRFTLPPDQNVNVTHEHWFGWEKDLMSFPVYVGASAVIVTLVFFGVEKWIRAAGWRAD